jgi:hypothetical protein
MSAALGSINKIQFSLSSPNEGQGEEWIDRQTFKPDYVLDIVDTDPKNNPELGSKNLPAEMTSEQVEVFDLLEGFSTPENQFHKWYQGTLEIINSQSPDKIAQAAHSLRELCDKLPNAIAQIPKFINPISAVKSLGQHFFEVKAQTYGDSWTGKIINRPLDGVLLRFETIFKEPARSKRLGRALTATDPQANVLSKDWRRERDKVFEDLYGFFQNVAHHNFSPTEAVLKEKMELFEALLLNYLTPCTAAQQRELLGLMAASANDETYARVSELILHKTANLHFFFDKLDNPNWLLFLDQKGIFQKLPGPEPTDDGRIMYRHHLPLIAQMGFQAALLLAKHQRKLKLSV